MKTNKLQNTVPIKDMDERAKFREQARKMGLDPDNIWIGGYVDYEWGQIRHTIQAMIEGDGNKIMEFGCNLGATTIVSALLGHKVYSVDIEENMMELAKFNAGQYGVSDITDFKIIVPAGKLPFEDNSFDAIICNSVLEYVEDQDLQDVMQELDRTLKPGGIMMITGTSSRLSPKEVHSGRWFINYLPKSWGRALCGRSYECGLNPFKVMSYISNYENIDLENGGKKYFDVKRECGNSNTKLFLLKIINLIFRPFKISVGMLTPSFSVNVKKPR